MRILRMAWGLTVFLAGCAVIMVIGWELAAGISGLISLWRVP